MDVMDKRDLRKAHSLANWSLIGFVIPLLGIIFAGISKSKLNHLSDQGLDSSDQAKVDRVRSSANAGLAISISVIVISFGLWAISLSPETAPSAQTTTTAQTQAQVLEQAKQAKQQALNDCLDRVNQAVSETAKSQPQTYDAAALLLIQQQQYTDQCKTKYPLN